MQNFQKKTTENRVQGALEGLKLGTVKTQIIDFLGLSVETYSNHIEVKTALRDVMSIQKVGNMPAADNKMSIGVGLVGMAGIMIGKLQWMTTLVRPDLSKGLNDALSLSNTAPTWGRGLSRAFKKVVRLYKRRPIQAMKF